ncbi:rod shape-determining protein RodA [Candidatus Sumerlaeota bacterium]|nr:rod shape-determining protein RodA [Candidatus Sumerlaeota bacterium]
MTSRKITSYIEGKKSAPGSIAFTLKNMDYLLLLLVMTVTGLGVIVIYGSTYSIPGLREYAWKQVVWGGIGLVFFLALSLLDLSKVRHLIWPVYILVILSLVLLFFMGLKVKGARSWYAVGTIRIQPSEFAKIVVIICLAYYLSHIERQMTRIRDIVAPALLVGLPSALILIQPDFGTASLFFPILLIMLYIAGCSKRLILLLILLAVWISLSAYPFLKPYQKARIKVFLNPGYESKWHGYNIRQAEISLGSGGIRGKGWKQGTQTQLRFLPERHTDFIFSSLGEQFGIVGCLSLLFLYTFIVLRSLRPSITSLDRFGQLTITGLVACFIIHIIFNIGMSLRLLPVTGLPLPLFSYGGSFLLTNYIIFGIIESIYMRKYLY